MLVPAWGAVAQGGARGLGALYVGAALSLLGRLGKYFCTMAFATFAFAALGKLRDKFCRAFAPLLSLHSQSSAQLMSWTFPRFPKFSIRFCK